MYKKENHPQIASNDVIHLTCDSPQPHIAGYHNGDEEGSLYANKQ